jgi:phosphatidylglycerophosphatase A
MRTFIQNQTQTYLLSVERVVPCRQPFSAASAEVAAAKENLRKSKGACHASMNWSLFMARLGGIGNFPFAPGTVATVFAGVPMAWLLAGFSITVALTVIGLLFSLACYVAEKAEASLKRHDPREVVIDELIGYLVTMVGFPISLKSLLIGFLAFRLFDIWKPWPVSVLDERLPGGLGVVMDDVAAGCLAHLLLGVVLAAWR